MRRLRRRDARGFTEELAVPASNLAITLTHFAVAAVVACLVYALSCWVNRRVYVDFGNWIGENLDVVGDDLRELRSVQPNNPHLAEATIVEATDRLRKAVKEGRASATLLPVSWTCLQKLRLPDDPDQAEPESDAPRYELRIAIFWSPFCTPRDRLRHELVHHCDMIAFETEYRKAYQRLGLRDTNAAIDSERLTRRTLASVELRVLKTAEPRSGFRRRSCQLRRPIAWFFYRLLWQVIIVLFVGVAIALGWIYRVDLAWNNFYSPERSLDDGPQPRPTR